MMLVLFVPHLAAAQGRPLVIGSISGNPTGEIAEWAPFAKYLAGRLTDAGISEGRVVVARNEIQMAKLLSRGEVDLYIDSPVIALLVAAAAGNKPLLRRWKRGRASYASVIFARADSPLASLEDLKGHSIAFQNTFSTTGYQLPKLALHRAGLHLVPLARVGAAIPRENVGYAFSEEDANTRAWVLQGRVDAGATGSGHFERWNDDDKLKIIWRSKEIPRQILTYRKDLTPSLVSATKKALLSMHLSDEGRAVLQAFEQTTQFDEIPANQLAHLEQIAADIESSARHTR